MLFVPESPVYLLAQNKREEAEKSMQWFRGSKYDISEEISQVDHDLKFIQL